MRNIITVTAGLFLSLATFVSPARAVEGAPPPPACELGCFTFPNLYKPFTNSYPCTNGSFQFQPYYYDNTEGNNVTLTFQPTNGGTLSNIVNGQGTSITWTHVGNFWTGHPKNFVAHGLYSWALYASGANCTVQGKAE